MYDRIRRALQAALLVLMTIMFGNGMITTARADEPAYEAEESAPGDAQATARAALDKAQQALDAQAGFRRDSATIAGHTAAIEDLRQQIREMRQAGAPQADIAAIEQRLAAAVKVEADRATREADRAKAEADRAESAATRANASAFSAATSAGQASTSAEGAATSAATGGNSSSGGSNSLDSALAINRDAGEHKLTGYGIVGLDSSAFGREASYGEEVSGMLVLETPELTSWMVGGFGGVGVRDFGPGGRLHVGVELFVDYNVGGGTHLGGGLTFGGYVEKTHTVRFSGTLGADWEMIPEDAAGIDAYENFRYLVGVNADVMLADHWLLRLTGRGMMDNRIPLSEGSAAGQAGAGIAYQF